MACPESTVRFPVFGSRGVAAVAARTNEQRFFAAPTHDMSGSGGPIDSSPRYGDWFDRGDLFLFRSPLPSPSLAGPGLLMNSRKYFANYGTINEEATSRDARSSYTCTLRCPARRTPLERFQCSGQFPQICCVGPGRGQQAKGPR